MLHVQLETGRAVLARAAAGVAALDEAARALRSQGEEAAQLVAAQPSSSGEARGFRGASRTRTEQQPAVVAAAEALRGEVVACAAARERAQVWRVQIASATSQLQQSQEQLQAQVARQERRVQ